MAAVATVLVSRLDEVAGADGPAARGLAAVNAFHAAFWVIVVVAVLGALTAAIAFPRRTTQEIEPEPGPVPRFDTPGANEESLTEGPGPDGPGLRMGKNRDEHP